MINLITGLLLSICNLSDNTAYKYAVIINSNLSRVQDIAINPEVIVRLMEAESNCNALALNKRTGAAGLLQIMPVHYEGQKFNIYDPAVNIKLGIRILLTRILECKYSMLQAITRYNGRKECRSTPFSRSILSGIDSCSIKYRKYKCG